MASRVSFIRIGGYTLFEGSEVRVKDNKMYTAVNGTVANNINMLSQCVMEVVALYGGSNAYNPIQLKWKSGPSGSYNGGGFIKTSQVVSGSGSPNNFIVNYEANGGSGSMPQSTFTYGQSNKLSACAFKMTGHSFAGWRAYRDCDNKWRGYNPDGKDGWYPQNQIITYYLYGDGSTMKTTAPHGTVYLYAQWQPNNYTATYKANGGNGADKTQSCVYGQKFTSFAANTFSRTGYTFQHWLLNNSSKDTWGASATAVYGWASNVTFYAAWKANTYKITYKGNGGKWNGTDTWSDDVVFDTNYYVESNFFDREGYTFVGWNTQPDGSGEDWSDTIGKPWKWNRAYNVTVYAIWRINTYTVTFNANGGTCSETSRRVNWGSKVGALPTPSKPYHEFLGWFTAASGGSRVTSDLIIKNNVTLYAQWKMKSLVYTKVNGQWVRARAYVKTGGQWKFALPYTKRNGTWKRSVGG